MGLAEILAAKKAKAEQISSPAPTEAPKVETTEVETIKEEALAPAGKPLTFAEKMALKKQQSTTTPATAASVVSAASSGNMPEDKVESHSTPPALSPEIAENHPPKEEADPITAQAYADIAARIQALNDLSDIPLKNAMSELKKALMANPNAVSLMLDTDYGQMVIALRRLTKQDQVEAETEKKKGTSNKKKKIDFSNPEEVQAVFDEL